jgi:hypothetical protein
MPRREPPRDTSWLTMESVSSGPSYGAILAPLLLCIALAVVIVAAVLT